MLNLGHGSEKKEKIMMLEEFLPRSKLPLVVSFSNFLETEGYIIKIGFDFWDVYAFKDHDDPMIAVTTIKNHLNSTILTRIADSNTPTKIILVEGDKIHLDRIEHESRFLAMMGVGVYVREVGWVVLPGVPVLEVGDDFVYKTMERYTMDDAGNWGKHCKVCGVWTPTTGFYDSSYHNSRDPKRHVCKRCHNA